MTSQEKAEFIEKIADDMKAEEIVVMNVREKTSLADFFVVCSATNDRMLEAIADRVAEKLKEQHGVRPLRTEGAGGGWILQDYGDVILHVMRDEQRQLYDLETLWKTLRPSPDLP